MLQAKFVYGEYGYLFLTTEIPKLALEITSDKQGTVTIKGKTVDYKENFVEDILIEGTVEKNTPKTFEIPVKCTMLGYFRADLEVALGDETVTKVTGFGLTTPHDRVCVDDSVFGISSNCDGEGRTWPLFARMGMRYMRAGDVPEREHLLRKYGLYVQEQAQGYDMYPRWNGSKRFARPKDNSAYYYAKYYGDLCKITEHGNECWEESSMSILSEWHKVTGFSRLSANPSGWYGNTGMAGCDINKLSYMYDNGVFDYMTTLCLHAYSFPGLPEGNDSYWSVSRLKDIAKFMDERGIEMPVCCTEQGYPALYDQTKCECYSPGELSTFDGQTDYLVRSWLVFLSLGVAKVIYFNGPWYEGFGVLEKEGPAPWPAAMALCNLVRAIDHADYIGDYEGEEGTYYKIFRNRTTGRLLGAVWHPVYYSRSSIKEKNLSLDGKYYESEGKAQEIFDYKLHDLDSDWYAEDIMGNRIDVKNETVQIGERPVYIYNINESIVPKLVDKRVFKTKTVKAKPLPCSVILGITDSWPSKAHFQNSCFKPGDWREYTVRVHNYSDVQLEDTLVITSPEGFVTDKSEIKVSVRAGRIGTYKIRVGCGHTTPMGDDHRITAKLLKTPAHEAFQTATVFCPAYFKPIHKPLQKGDALTFIVSTSLENKKYTYEFIPRNKGMAFENSEVTTVIDKSAPFEFELKVCDCPENYEPVIDVRISDENGSAVYEVAIETDYIEFCDKTDAVSIAAKQKSVVSGYNMTMTAATDYKGPALVGCGKPQPMNSYMRVEADDKKLYFHFDIKDPRVVCTKNTRRNNMDSDGVWIKFFNKMEDEKPLRHFTITPVDQAGNTKGCAVDEVSKDILFATPYTDYDFSKIKVSSTVYGEGYTLYAEIDKDSLGYETIPDDMIIDIRVVNMNDDDWSKYYETGKRLYKLIK